jgi:hypothetical protein
VVVARSERVKVAEAVEGDGVLSRGVTDGSGVAGDATLGNVVGRLGTSDEAVTADDSVSGEGGALSVISVSKRSCKEASVCSP